MITGKVSNYTYTCLGLLNPHSQSSHLPVSIVCFFHAMYTVWNTDMGRMYWWVRGHACKQIRCTVTKIEVKLSTFTEMHKELYASTRTLCKKVGWCWSSRKRASFIHAVVARVVNWAAQTPHDVLGGMTWYWKVLSLVKRVNGIHPDRVQFSNWNSFKHGSFHWWF